MQENTDTYNRGGYIAFLFSMIFSFLFFIYVALIHPGIDLKEIPAEAKVQTEGQAAPAGDVSSIDKPWEPNEAMVARGKAVFQQNCTACHGQEGKGDGPGAAGLVPPPRNLVEGKWKQGGDSISLYKTIAGGIPGSSMVGFAHLPGKDRWGLVQFIHSITTNKSADDSAKLEEFAKTAK